MRRPIIAVVCLVVAFGLGGAAGWHLTRPDQEHKLGDQASTMLKTLPTPKAPISTPTPVSTSATPTPTKGLVPVSYPKEATPDLHSSGWGVIRIPGIGLKAPLVEGTDEASDLSRGVGHYVGTALPGQLGNFALAGHVCCASNGQPFKNLYKLHEDDIIFIDTEAARYTYKVIDETACGPTQMTVHMSRIQVIDPVPCSTAKPVHALMTLTTCVYPNGEKPPAIHRRIVWAELVLVEPRG